jgi:putative transposase
MDEIYHVYNRSIDEIKIFNNDKEYDRFIQAIRFYQIEKQKSSFCSFLKQLSHRNTSTNWNNLFIGKEKLVEIVAYCVMPAHFHLTLKQLINDGVVVFISNLLNSHSRYFNRKYKRKGALWEGRTKKVLMKSDEQLLHITRYIHLNPVTAYLVNKPEEWPWSSYKEYILNIPIGKRICEYSSFLNVEPMMYKKFVEDGIGYQRERAKVKSDI